LLAAKKVILEMLSTIAAHGLNPGDFHARTQSNWTFFCSSCYIDLQRTAYE